MDIKQGSRWQSTVCDTEVIVVRPPAGDVVLRCGGAPMAPQGADEARGPLDASLAGGTLIGKRYEDPESATELLCTKAGEGTLSIDGRAVQVKAAKALPASD